MFHIVSDLQLSYLDPALDQHNLSKIPEYIILTGNNSKQNKRTMLYAEALAQKYQNSKIVFNYGILEMSNAEYYKIQDGFRLHINDFKRSPKNLYYPKGVCLGEYDFYCAVGWPTFTNEDNFLNFISKVCIISAFDEHLYIDDIFITEKFHRYLTLDEIKKLADNEKEQIKIWLSNNLDKQKILISSLGNQSSHILGDNFRVFEGLDLSNITWICGSKEDFIGEQNGCKIVSLPGGNRTRYLNNNFTLLD